MVQWSLCVCMYVCKLLGVSYFLLLCCGEFYFWFLCLFVLFVFVFCFCHAAYSRQAGPRALWQSSCLSLSFIIGLQTWTASCCSWVPEIVLHGQNCTASASCTGVAPPAQFQPKQTNKRNQIKVLGNSKASRHKIPK